VWREQRWQLEGSAGVGLGTGVKGRDGAKEIEELKEESSEFVNISKNRYEAQPNKLIFTNLSLKTKTLLLTQNENFKPYN